ncbi:MAG: hypothetical protein HY690_10625 [Chloroflexi bacterium]|nr:hypothetical protein [Chloroflexota bacterium]
MRPIAPLVGLVLLLLAEQPGVRPPAAWAQAAAPATATLRVEAGQPLRRISPLIYGAASANPDDLAALRLRLNRWGGTPSSRYNWELGNAWNSGRDWEFRNGNYGHTSPADRRPSGVADQFVAANRAAGAESLVTIPALGWVARDDDNESRSVDIPESGSLSLGALVDGRAVYDPAANRRATSIRSLPRKDGPLADPPDLADDRVYQDEWVAHLGNRFGSAATGGVRFYAIDNEPDLWAENHADVYSIQPGYDDLLASFLEYAEAIKAVDPEALVLGPGLSGWTSYLYSARDRGLDNFRTHADRRAHGDVPFLPWWLDQVRRHDEQTGRRTLDVLDVHFYPQAAGVYDGATDDATNALRLRSTRALWDARYADESWIREPVRLVPRLREWVDRSYPGTLLAIGEWNWGAEETMNGALAIANVLGIFGREGVDLAAYWTVPPAGSPGALAFALYTNYDGRGSGFGDLALAATSDTPDLAVYASLDSASGDLVLLALNQRPDVDLSATLHLDGFAPSSSAHLYRYAQADPTAIHTLGQVALQGQELSLTLPSYSITVVRVAG